jgi:hypothetical protein
MGAAEGRRVTAAVGGARNTEDGGDCRERDCESHASVSASAGPDRPLVPVAHDRRDVAKLRKRLSFRVRSRDPYFHFGRN